jgi:hypothetical protein
MDGYMWCSSSQITRYFVITALLLCRGHALVQNIALVIQKWLISQKALVTNHWPSKLIYNAWKGCIRKSSFQIHNLHIFATMLQCKAKSSFQMHGLHIFARTLQCNANDLSHLISNMSTICTRNLLRIIWKFFANFWKIFVSKSFDGLTIYWKLLSLFIPLRFLQQVSHPEPASCLHLGSAGEES